MAAYTYETHLHTSETSQCGRCSGADFARFFHSLGYTGIFVTDHFLNGNTTVPKDLPWSERIALFGRGYDVTAQTGAELGLAVFFAWEYSYGWAHFLTYGLSKEWLLAHPDLLEWNVLEYLDRVRADGGSVVHAHPFRDQIDLVQLIPGKVDAVEVVNAAQTDDANRYARDFAVSHGLLQTAGSDIHATHAKRLCGVVSSRRLTGAGGDYLSAVASGEAVPFDNRLTAPPSA